MAQLSPTEIQYELEHIHQDRAPDIIASYAICLSLACIAVVLRFVARRTSRASLQADDLTVFIALLFATGQIIAGSFAVHLGAGKHVVLITDPAAYAKCVITVEMLYSISAALFKFSALLLYHRLFGSSKRFTVWLWVLAAVILCYSVAEVLFAVLQCHPIQKTWNMELPGFCLNAGLVATVLGVFNVAADFATVFMPLPLIWNLHMQRKWKIQLIGIFLLSAFVCACSIYRVTILNRLSLPDVTWANTEPAIWAAAENCIGIVSASLPTMRPIYNLIVRGHHCSSHERYCSRCEHSRISGRRSRLRFGTKWPGSASSSAGEGTRNARSSTSDIESANRSDSAVEMVLHAKGPVPALEGVVRITTTVEIS
ncbi:hypothetical protein HO173_000738 [Letharia columbiana]|uniref:Rhodopsin domain-containing protein n=1 Tax=Letharia columbiana TaxID=112416 RepID=A0A8H6G5H2_9LECA|nr:uncharacterized protein HO173_000738 [Letharia columbiana]KAF6240945.1 hypothetical protein HO173_000738 [Letharia columbiana]